MNRGSYLLDSNILIRWLKPNDRDYRLVNLVIDQLLDHGSTLCYTSQNLGEFGTRALGPPIAMGMG